MPACDRCVPCAALVRQQHCVSLPLDRAQVAHFVLDAMELLPHLIEAADYGPVVVAAISFALEHVDEQVSLLAHGFGRRSGAECTQWE